jgi:pimeloyl-ACP methyl ester carboxylesterase
LNFVQNDLDSEEIILIGHSQGGLVIANLQPRGSKAVLMAPPLGEVFENFIKTPGWNRPGSELNLDGESQLIRSDGSLTTVPKEFWDEFRALGNVDPLIKELDANNSVKFYFAGEDNVLGDQEIPAGIEYATIAGANHDFVPPARGLVVGKIVGDLGL